MPSKFYACNRMLSSRNHSVNSGAIWISEDILADALHRFLHIQTRRGSSVPGPLEARRRANKRKNTNLAYAGHSAPIDLGALFGPGKQQASWWNISKSQPGSQNIGSMGQGLPVQPQTDALDQNPLAWLFDLPSSEPYAPNEATKFNEDLPEHLSDEDFATQLLGATDVDDIQSLLGVQPTPDRYEIALEHTLENGWKTEDINALLASRLQNCPQHEGHLQIMEFLTTRYDPRCKDLLKSIETAIELGQVTRAELGLIFRRLPYIVFPDKKGSPLSRNWEPAQYYSSFLSSLENCNSLSSEDLQPAVYRSLLSHLGATPFSPDISDIALRLFRKSRDAVLPEFPEVISQWIEFISQKYTWKQKEEDIKNLTTFLENLDQTGLAVVLNGASQRLIHPPESGLPNERAILIWMRILRNIEFKKNRLSHRHWNAKHHHRAGIVLHSGKAVFIKLWTASLISTNTTRLTSSPAHDTLLRSILNEYRRVIKRSTMDLYESLTLTAQKVPVPSNEILKVVAHILKIPVGQAAQLASNTTAFLADPMTVLQDDHSYRSIKDNLNHSLTKTCERVNADLPQFTEYACDLISRDRRNMTTILRILRHNTALKLALPMAHKLQDPHQKDVIFPRQCLQTINDLATAFAHSPCISNRQAYRMVQWFYTFLHRYGGPIGPDILRALYHAGISRYGERGPSVAQRVWVLSIIREIEGPEVARLVQAQGYSAYENMVTRSHKNPFTNPSHNQMNKSWRLTMQRVPGRGS